MPDGTLIQPPAWYSPMLPKFYWQAGGVVKLFPEGAIKYTAADVLDCLLYMQTWCGYNRADWQNAVSVAWFKTDGGDGAKLRIENHFKGVAGSNGNFNWVPNYNLGLDGTLYSQLQARYIQNEGAARAWLSAMQGKGQGIDLMTIPSATDREIPRPFWYTNYLPSLFTAAGVVGQYPAGFLDTKPKIRGYNSLPADVSNLCVYAQPVINAGPTPYPTNWYINDIVNGAVAFRFKISFMFFAGFTDSQEQVYGMSGDMMKAPVLDADPYTSGFSKTLQSIVSAAISFFAGKVPGGSKLVNAAYAAGNLSGGAFITGTDVPPAGPFSAAVFQAANALNQKNEQRTTEGKYLLYGLGAAAVLAAVWAHDEGYL